MAYSRVIKIGDGSTTQFAVNFALGYLNQGDVRCRVGSEVDGLGNPVYRPLTFLSSNLIQVGGTPAGVGVTLTFERTVSKDTLVVDFANGDVLDEDNLNLSQKQALMAVQEVLDGRFSEFNSDVTFGGYRITNLGAPVNSNDAVNKAYVDASTGGLANYVTEIQTVASIKIPVQQTAAIASSINTVAGIASSVSNVAAAASILSGYAGALSITHSTFTGDGTQINFTLPYSPLSKDNLLVFIGGAVQKSSDFSVSGTTLTISPAVEAGVEILVRTMVLVSSAVATDAAIAAQTYATNAANSAAAAATFNPANFYTKTAIDTTLSSTYYTKTAVDSALASKLSIPAQTLTAIEQAQVQANIGLKAANFGRVRLRLTNGYGSTNTKIRRFSTVVSNSGSDITYTDSATLGASFTIVNDGVYAVSFSAQGASAMGIGISLNSSQLTTNSQSLTDGSLLIGCLSANANYGAGVSWSGFLSAGDIIRAHTDGTAAGTNTAMDTFTIQRIA